MTNAETVAVALSAIDLSKVDVEALKLALMDREIDPGKMGVKRLATKAIENDIEVPMIQPTPVESEGETGTVEAAEADETETPEAEVAEATPEAGAVEAAEAEPKKSRNVVPQKYRQRYGAAQNNGDQVAKVLANFTKNKDGTANSTAIEAVATLNGVERDVRATADLAQSSRAHSQSVSQEIGQLSAALRRHTCSAYSMAP